jgi:hypothetical protein
VASPKTCIPCAGAPTGVRIQRHGMFLATLGGGQKSAAAKPAVARGILGILGIVLTARSWRVLRGEPATPQNGKVSANFCARRRSAPTPLPRGAISKEFMEIALRELRVLFGARQAAMSKCQSYITLYVSWVIRSHTRRHKVRTRFCGKRHGTWRRQW